MLLVKILPPITIFSIKNPPYRKAGETMLDLIKKVGNAIIWGAGVMGAITYIITSVLSWFK